MEVFGVRLNLGMQCLDTRSELNGVTAIVVVVATAVKSRDVTAFDNE